MTSALNPFDRNDVPRSASVDPFELAGGVTVLPVNVSITELDFVALVIGWGLSLA